MTLSHQGQRGAKPRSPRARTGITTTARPALDARLPDCSVAAAAVLQQELLASRGSQRVLTGLIAARAETRPWW